MKEGIEIKKRTFDEILIEKQKYLCKIQINI